MLRDADYVKKDLLIVDYLSIFANRLQKEIYGIAEWCYGSFAWWVCGGVAGHVVYVCAIGCRCRVY